MLKNLILRQKVEGNNNRWNISKMIALTLLDSILRAIGLNWIMQNVCPQVYNNKILFFIWKKNKSFFLQSYIETLWSFGHSECKRVKLDHAELLSLRYCFLFGIRIKAFFYRVTDDIWFLSCKLSFILLIKTKSSIFTSENTKNSVHKLNEFWSFAEKKIKLLVSFMLLNGNN